MATDSPTTTEPDDPFAAKNRFLGIGVVRDPHPRIAELREECPVHRGSVSGQFGTVGPDNYLIPDDDQLLDPRLPRRRGGLPGPGDVLQLLLRAVPRAT